VAREIVAIARREAVDAGLATMPGVPGELVPGA